jgi:hypothetical protein
MSVLAGSGSWILDEEFVFVRSAKVDIDYAVSGIADEDD